MLSEPLDISFINANVGEYWRVNMVELTASTQSDLVSLVRSAQAHPGDVITAEFQSRGRGRLSRSFEAPTGTALLFSFFIAPARTRQDWGWIPLIAGASVAQVLSHLHAAVKWPNDILIKDKKISGIIAEAIDEGIVIGIGINVGMKESELPVPHATSLYIQGSLEKDRNQILIEFLNIFYINFTNWDNGGDEIIAIYQGLSATIGRPVRIEYPDDRLEVGTAVAISKAGELVLDTGTHVQAGDIIHLR